MAESLILKFDVKDDGSIKIKKITDSIDDLEKSLKSSEKQAHRNIASLKNMALAVGGLSVAYGSLKIVKTAISDGFEYNRMMENQIKGLQRLIVATSGDVDSKGNALDITQKYTLAMQDATEAMKGLEEINALTPHTLGQTTQIFNAMFASMKKTGASTEEMIELTKRLSIASSNLDFNAVLAGVDGLASGTVMANSDFGRFINSLGLTNEVLKNTDNVAKLVNDRLSEMVVPARSMDEATSNLTNAWQQLTGEMTKNIFAETKDYVNDLSKFLVDARNSLHDFMIEWKSAAELEDQSDLDKKAIELAQRYDDAIKGISDSWTRLGRNMAAADLKEVNNELYNLNIQYSKLQAKAGAGGGELVSSLAPESKPELGLSEDAKQAISDYKQELKAEDVLESLRLQNEMIQNNVGGIEYLNDLRRIGVSLETETGRQLVEQMALRDQLKEEGATAEDTTEKIETIRDAYSSLRESMFSEEALWAKFAGEAVIVEEAFNQKMVTEIERKALLEQLEQDHQKRITDMIIKSGTERQKFESKNMKDKTKTVLGEMATLTAGVAGQNKAMFEINKVAALANAGISMYEGISLTMSKYPYPLNIGMAALHGAAALAQISSIQSQSFGGGGATTTPTAGGGSVTTPGIAPSNIPGPTTEEATVQTRTITVSGLEPGKLVTTDFSRELLETLKEEAKDMGLDFDIRFAG